MILSIDPGNIESAYCIIETETYKPIEFGKIENNNLLKQISMFKDIESIVIEKVASYGMAVGQTIFDTCEWYGRFIQKYCDTHDDFKINYVYRKEVKLNLCNSSKAKDSNVRQALIDRFAKHDFKNGKGKKATPDFFYGFSKDVWSAFAVGCTYLDKVTYEK